MITELKESFGAPKEHDENSIMGTWKVVPVLIIDDLGKQQINSEWWPQKLYDLIDDRIMYNNTTIFTSNLSLKEIAYRYGPNFGTAIYSRLMGECKVWELSGPDPSSQWKRDEGI